MYNYVNKCTHTHTHYLGVSVRQLPHSQFFYLLFLMFFNLSQREREREKNHLSSN